MFLREGSQARTCHLRDSPALMRPVSAHSWRKWIENRRETGAKPAQLAVFGGVFARARLPIIRAALRGALHPPPVGTGVRLEGAVSSPTQRRSPADVRVVSFFLAFRQARAGIGGFSLFFIKERPAI